MAVTEPTMNVTEVAVFQVDLPIKDGTYDWSGGQSHASFDSTIVRLQTSEGITGWGETTTLGSAYLPAYAGGVRSGIEELVDVVIGADPSQPAVIGRHMDRRLQGHPYVKSAVDIACWDILGKVTGEPVVTLLGGRFEPEVPLYRAISQGSPSAMADRVTRYRKQGYRRFQLKIGEDARTDGRRIRAARERLDSDDILIADANTGLTQHDAIRLVKAVEDFDVYIEQPCDTFQSCQTVRQHTDLPYILDESIDSIDMLVRAYAANAMDMVNLKISKVGGLTKARQFRDLACELGVVMIIEDTWASEIGTAAMAHLAQSTPPDMRLATTDFFNYNDVTTASGAPAVTDGTIKASAKPGLGVSPDMNVLGDPIAVYP